MPAMGAALLRSRPRRLWPRWADQLTRGTAGGTRVGPEALLALLRARADTADELRTAGLGRVPSTLHLGGNPLGLARRL